MSRKIVCEALPRTGRPCPEVTLVSVETGERPNRSGRDVNVSLQPGERIVVVVNAGTAVRRRITIDPATGEVSVEES